MAQHQQTKNNSTLTLHLTSSTYSHVLCADTAVSTEVTSSDLPTILLRKIADQLHEAWKQHDLSEGQD